MDQRSCVVFCNARCVCMTLCIIITMHLPLFNVHIPSFFVVTVFVDCHLRCFPMGFRLAALPLQLVVAHAQHAARTRWVGLLFCTRWVGLLFAQGGWGCFLQRS